MKLSHEKIVQVSHRIMGAIEALDEVEIFEEPNTIRQETVKILDRIDARGRENERGGEGPHPLSKTRHSGRQRQNGRSFSGNITPTNFANSALSLLPRLEHNCTPVQGPSKESLGLGSQPGSCLLVRDRGEGAEPAAGRRLRPCRSFALGLGLSGCCLVGRLALPQSGPRLALLLSAVLNHLLEPSFDIVKFRRRDEILVLLGQDLLDLLLGLDDSIPGGRVVAKTEGIPGLRRSCSTTFPKKAT